MRITILGAGKQAQGVLYYLINRDYVKSIVVADFNDDACKELIRPYLPCSKLSFKKCDAETISDLVNALEGSDTAISCLPYRFNANATYAAIKTGCHLVDLGGNNEVVRQQFTFDEAARAAGVTIVPDAGLAPGLVSVLTADAINSVPGITSVSIKVGGLPAHPTLSGPLKYAEVFSLDGLVNEYIEPAVALSDGKVVERKPLSDLEDVILFQRSFEAFSTSGGISTLAETFKDKVKNLEYKTLRYPGHHAILKVLLELNQLTVNNLRKLIPKVKSDVVYGCVEAEGYVKNKLHNKRYTLEVKSHYDTEYNINISAMAQATAFPAALIATMLPDIVTERGVKKQECVIDPQKFIKTIREDLPIRIKNVSYEV